MPDDEFADFFDIEIDLEGEFQTLAGYILALLGYIPAVAEKIPACGLTLEIMDLDGRRIDRVLVTRSAASEDVT
jgi:putative hemolysin